MIRDWHMTWYDSCGTVCLVLFVIGAIGLLTISASLTLTPLLHDGHLTFEGLLAWQATGLFCALSATIIGLVGCVMVDMIHAIMTR
jgi:hypothetical protein